MTSLLAASHLLASLALGLLIGQQRWSRAVLLVYGAAVLAGLGAIALAYVPALAQEGLLAGVAAAGGMLAWARPWPQWLGAAVAAGIGVAFALDSPPETLSLTRANLELGGTAAVAIGSVWAIARLGRWLNRPSNYQIGPMATRILGSWIAASAILVLALRLLR